MINRLKQKLLRRNLQVILGILWLIDGLLQLQPKMFSSSFAYQVIAPASLNQPTIIADPMHFLIKVILHHPAIYDLLFAIIQLIIGSLIINKSTTKKGLVLSICWGMFVWILGEGMGGLATSQALLLTGAPGAALIYCVIALGVMPKHHPKSKDKPDSWLAYAWMALWMGGAVLLLASGENAVKLASIISTNATFSPNWLAQIDFAIAHDLRSGSSLIILITIVVYLLIGFSSIFSHWIKYLGLVMGIILAMGFWLIGQSLGGLGSGLATDLNSGPLIVLLALAVFSGPNFSAFTSDTTVERH